MKILNDSGLMHLIDTISSALHDVDQKMDETLHEIGNIDGLLDQINDDLKRLAQNGRSTTERIMNKEIRTSRR